MDREQEMVNGYLAGTDGKSLLPDASPAFKHGWKNGRRDFGYETDRQRAEVLRRRAQMILGRGA